MSTKVTFAEPRTSGASTPIGWSWRLGEVSGIAIYVHASFFLLIAWFAFAYWLEVGNFLRVVSGVALLLSLFGCVLLHELGHALTAKRFGLATRQITLLPIGGIASLERLPDDPFQGLWIALAGPAVNLIIALGLLAILLSSGEWMPIDRISLTEGPFLERLMLMNVSLLVFKMLPAFPMDGGRALRAILATRMDGARATQIAARLGQGMAVLFGIIGWLGNPLLVLMAIPVWMGAAQEATTVEVRTTLRGVPVDRVMVREFRTLAPDDRLSAVIDLVLRGAQRDFPVISDSHVAGILTRRDL
jgi:Zn-dependent protease